MPPALCGRWHVSASTLGLSVHVKCKERLSPEASERMQREAICKVPLGHKRQLIPISAPITHRMVWGQIQNPNKEGNGATPRRREGTSQWLWGWVLCELPICSLLADQVLPPSSEAGLTHTGKAGDGSGAQGPYMISEGQRGVGVESVHGSTQSVCVSHSVMPDSLWPHGLPPARLFWSPWDSPGKNTEVGCHSFLQGIFLTQGSNPGLLHCRWILYHLCHQGSMGSLSSVQSLSRVRLFATPWTAARQASCPSPAPRAYSNPCLSSRGCHPTISSSIIPFFSCL